MRLIDADKLDWWYKGRPIRRVIDEAPTIDAVEAVHGRWEWKPIQNKHWILYCSVCSGTKNASEDCNYCPNCGAKMDGDGNA